MLPDFQFRHSIQCNREHSATVPGNILGNTMERLRPPNNQGLSSAEAARLLAQIGPNEPAPRRGHLPVAQLLALFVNPLVVILLIAAAASGFLGEYAEAVLIAVIVAVGVVINFIQTYRSQQAAEKLRQQVAPTATVIRDGVWHEAPRREIVPGDLIRLSAGDLVPADAALVSNRKISTSSRRR